MESFGKTVYGLMIASVFVLLSSGCGLISREDEDGVRQQGGRENESGVELREIEGRVQSVIADSNRFALKPAGEDRILFRVNDDLELSIDGEDAALEDLREGQRGTVSYVVRGEGRSIARTVDLRNIPQNAPSEDTMEETTDTAGQN